MGDHLIKIRAFFFFLALTQVFFLWLLLALANVYVFAVADLLLDKLKAIITNNYVKSPSKYFFVVEI